LLKKEPFGIIKNNLLRGIVELYRGHRKWRGMYGSVLEEGI
jgi:hypothetical protein